MKQKIADNINKLIEQKGLKKKFVAKQIGVKDHDFSAMLSGRRTIKGDDILPIAKVLNVDPNQLCGYYKSGSDKPEAV